MKTLNPDLEAHFASGATTLAWCWKITRVDGEVFGFTDHDRALSFDGLSFDPESGLIPAELRAGSDLAVDAQDAEGVLTSDLITETDIYDGLWDNAEVEVYRVNWSDVSQRVLMRRGSLGQVRRGRTMFVAEVRSMAHVLNQTVGRSYQATCDAALGDGRCRVNLELSAYKGTGAVTEIMPSRALAVSGLDGFGSSIFAAGVLEWTSGANTGRKAEVLRHDVSAGVVTLHMQYEAVRAVEVGDEFVVRAGCDKTRETCQAKFDNIANFRGFPDIPGQSTIYRYARRTGSNSGETL